MKSVFKILLLFIPFLGNCQNLGTGKFGKVSINSTSTPSERLYVNGTANIIGTIALNGNINYSPSVSQNTNADASSTNYQRFKWYVYNPTYNPTISSESKFVLQTTRRSGTISIKNAIVVDNGNVGIGIDDLDNEPSKTLTVGGDMKLLNQFFVNTSLYNYSEGNVLKVGSGGGVEGVDLGNIYALKNNAVFTGNATSPKFTVDGSGYIANGSDVAMGAGSTSDIVTYNTSGRILFSTAGSVRATITNTGNFGIGTIAPTSKFEVSGVSSIRYNDGSQADGKYLRSNSTGIASWAFVALSEITGLGSGVATFLATPSSANLLAALTTKTGTGNVVFSADATLTGTTNIATIANTAGGNFATSSGNVGIGVSVPTEKLQVDVANVVNAKFLKFSTANGVNNYGDISVQSAELRYGSPFSIGIAPNNTVSAFFKSDGKIGFGTVSPTQLLDVNGTAQANQFKLSALNTAPASATASGVLGEIRVTSGFIYVCTATNTWVRTSLATW